MAERRAKGAVLAVYTEAGREIGAGHLVRCSAYADAWQRSGGTVRWVIDGEQNFVSRFLPGDAEPLLAPWTKNGDFVSGAAIAIVDSYRADGDVLAAIDSRSESIVTIDDTCRLAYRQGLVVHSSPGPVAPLPGDTAVWALGPAWQPLRRPFRNLPRRKPADTVGTVLVVMGGSDVRGLAGRMAALAAGTFKAASIVMIGTDHAPDIERVRCVATMTADAMAAAMMEAELAISAAGQTSFELAAAGTPAVLIGVADNQCGHVSHWPETGAHAAAGMADDPRLDDRVSQTLEQLVPTEARARMAEAGQTLVDGHGVRRLFERLGFHVD